MVQQTQLLENLGHKGIAYEDVDNIVMDIFQTMNSGVIVADVDRSHRIGKPRPTGRPREIIVKFSTYRARQKVMRNRTTLRQSVYSDVYVN